MTSTFLDCLRKPPDGAVALVDETEQLTYGQLRHDSQQIATVLASQYGRGQYLLVGAQPTVRFVTTLLGVMYSGNTPIPVDPDLPGPGLAFIRQKSRAAAVLAPMGPREFADAEPGNHVDASVPALVLFTSGTTGFPKGVVISTGNLVHSCATITRYLEYHRHPSAAVVLPLHYSYALLSQVCCQLFVGGRVRLFRDLRNPAKFAEAVNAGGFETFCGVPSTYQALAVFHAVAPLHMPSIRVLCSAGAPMDPRSYTTVKALFPNATFFNNYGMTEAAPRIAYIREDDPRFGEPTCGKPMDGVEVKIVDRRTHEELRDGERGMLVVRGPNVTSGYLNDPELTRNAFTPDGYLISGDMAYKDRGYLFICGRYDDILNCGGQKVAPLEIERVLNRVSGVEMSAVIGVPDQLRGTAPVAFLKLRNPVSRKTVVEQLIGELPKAKIPQRYLEVRAFPTTPNGKLQRRQLSPDDPTYVIRELR